MLVIHAFQLLFLLCQASILRRCEIIVARLFIWYYMQIEEESDEEEEGEKQEVEENGQEDLLEDEVSVSKFVYAGKISDPGVRIVAGLK